MYYGSYYIDEIVAKEKPDIYFGVEDIWAFNSYWDKPWWNKIPCVLWVTLDSLPIIPEARENAHKIKNYWVWSSFAEKEMHKIGHKHVKTQNAVFDLSGFKRKPDWERDDLRANALISDDTVVFGFVFRNQLRKLIPVLLEAFKDFRDRNPDIKSKLLLHTSFQEGWPIQRLIKELEINPNEVVNTYVCGHCKGFQIAPYQGEAKDCPICHTKESLFTPSPQLGVSEEGLSEIYNVMDFYIHPMTSGGLEMPIVEALASELPVATVDYSCGEEYCQQEFVTSIPFDFYREFGYAAFYKAQPKREELAKILEDFAKMSPEERRELGKKGSEWAKEFYSVERTGKEIENFIDAQPHTQWSFDFTPNKFNTNYPFNVEIQDSTKWAIDLIKNVTFVEEHPEAKQIQTIINDLNQGVPREEIYKRVISAAAAHNEKSETLDISALIPKSDTHKIGFLSPGSQLDCFLTLGALGKLHEKYPNSEIYVVTQEENKGLFSHLTFVSGFIPFSPVMEDPQWLGGGGERKGIVDLVINPHSISNYTHS